MAAVAKWKPARARRKGVPPPSKGRLVGCVILLASALFLFYLLFSATLSR